MILTSIFAVVVGQSCLALLPPPDLQIDWSRNGQPYARDVPVRTSRLERVYRRSFANGSPDATRVLSCAEGARHGTTLFDRVGSAEDVVIPIGLARSRTVSVNGATVRRIDPPDDAGDGGTWFSVSRYGPQLFGLRERIGIEEIRTPTVSGRVEILRAVLAAIERPALPSSDDEERVARINAQLARQDRELQDLRDRLVLQQSLTDQQRRVWADSLIIMEHRYRALWAPYAGRAARMIADSAARLPSENEARMAAWFWPGAGHPHMQRSGALWAAASTIALGVVVAGIALPDATLVDAGLDPERVRTPAMVGGSASYLLLMLLSRASLNGAIQAARDSFATRESFLQAATVDLTPDGGLVVTVRKGVH